MSINSTYTGVPDGAARQKTRSTENPLDRKPARQKTRSTGCNYAGWEILALDYLLAGIFFQHLAC